MSLPAKGKAIPIAIMALLLWCFACRAQGYRGDTVRITLQEAETRFLKNNLQLIANKYGVEATRALILQAKLFDNPIFDYGQSIYNDQDHKWFPTGNADGAYSVSIEQLIHIAGQRNANIKIQKLNTQASEYTFYDLLRTLKFQLRSDFFNIGYNLESLKVYGLEMNSVDSMATAFQEQYKKGNLPEKEALRLKALSLSLISERNALNDEINSAMSDFRTLLADTTGSYFLPVLEDAKTDTFNVAKYTLPELTETAINNRYDLKSSLAGLQRDEWSVKYQRRLAAPDVNFGLNYQKNSSYPNNYYGLDLNLPLPIFNQNQGNIKNAKFTAKQTETNVALTRLNLDEDVIQAYVKALQYDRQYKQMDKSFAAQYETLMNGIQENFKKRNISLIDFVDYYESFKNNVLQWNQLRATRIIAIEQINYATGVDNFQY